MAKFTTTTAFIANGKNSSVSSGDLITFEGFTTKGDGGAATWKHNGNTGETVSQSPAQLSSALLNDASGNQWILVNDPINIKMTGAVGDGVADETTFITAAGTGNTQKEVIFPIGTYDLPTNATVNSDVKINLEKGATLTGAGIISGLAIVDFGLLSTSETSQSHLANSSTSQQGMVIQYRRQGTPTAASESDGLLVIATSDMDATTFNADVVGIGARGEIGAANTNGRAWGLNAFGTIRDGGDGQLYGIEVNIDNRGAANRIPDTQKAKYGINITTKATSDEGTAAIVIGTSSQWNYGIWTAPSAFVAANADSRFIELNNIMAIDLQGRIAVGHNSPTEHIHIKRTSGRSQLAIESDLGGEVSVKFTDTATRNWAIGMDLTSGQFRITKTSTVAALGVFQIDLNNNFGLNGLSVGGGAGNIFLANAVTVPTSNPTGGGIIYNNAGALTYRGPGGTITVLGAS